MSIEDRNRIIRLERRVDDLEKIVAKLIDERVLSEQPKTLKLTEKKSA